MNIEFAEKPCSSAVNDSKDDTFSNQDPTLVLRVSSSGSQSFGSFDLLKKNEHGMPVSNGEVHFEEENGRPSLGEINLFAFGSGAQEVHTQKVHY